MIILSKRQKEALDIFAKGKSMKEMAYQLGVSYSRVVTLLNEILLRTGIRTKKELLMQLSTLEYGCKEDEN